MIGEDPHAYSSSSGFASSITNVSLNIENAKTHDRMQKILIAYETG